VTDAVQLPPGVTVLERGWLSANNIVFEGAQGTALVDSGYGTHAAQTVALVTQVLRGRALDLLINTHLHSDHCGGNAALQAAFPAMATHVPPGQAEAVRRWDEDVLSYRPTGQWCPAFKFDGLVHPGDELVLADQPWQVHAAPGHDPHSIILFEPSSRTLLSADALWQDGFGVVFPELEGESAFDEVARVLDLIEALEPTVVVPGHGAVFAGAGAIAAALARARGRLSSFVADPARHAGHAVKVLIKFKLLEWQRIPLQQLSTWAAATSYLPCVAERYFAGVPFDAWLSGLVDQLIRSGVLARDGDAIVNI